MHPRTPYFPHETRNDEAGGRLGPRVLNQIYFQMFAFITFIDEHGKICGEFPTCRFHVSTRSEGPASLREVRSLNTDENGF